MPHEPIRLIVGLGNPGAKHETDRHNVGFWFVDALAQRYAAQFHEDRKFLGEVARVNVDGNDLRLLKPQTYMNRSGSSVQAIRGYFGLMPEQIVVAHDDLDLPPGTVRLKRGGGHGGHNGLRDLVAHIGPEFFRLRIGIGHPGNKAAVIGYVLNRAGSEDEDKICAALGDALDVLPILLGEGDQRAMSRLNRRPRDPEPMED